MIGTVAIVALVLVGLCVGSFLNVCIYRLPREISVVFPPSHCPRCKKLIKPYDNIPLISFIILRGKCRYCQGKISWRYPLVEFLTALFFVLFYYLYGLTLQFIWALVFTSILIAIFFIDLEHWIIPDQLSFSALGLGLAKNLADIFLYHKGLTRIHLGHLRLGIPEFFLGALFGASVFIGIILFGMFLGYLGLVFLKRETIFRKKESMGGGDIMLGAAIGANLGWKMAGLSFMMAVFIGALVGGVLLLIKRKQKEWEHYIPFGPFMVLGALCFIIGGKSFLNLLRTFWDLYISLWP